MQLGLKPRLRTKNSLWDLVHKRQPYVSEQPYQELGRATFSEKTEFGSWGVEVDVEALPPLPNSPAPSLNKGLKAPVPQSIPAPIDDIKMAPVRPFTLCWNVCLVEKEADR